MRKELLAILGVESITLGNPPDSRAIQCEIGKQARWNGKRDLDRNLSKEEHMQESAKIKHPIDARSA